MMLVLFNVTVEPSNVRKKKKKSPNVTKVRLYMILALHNVRMKLSNVRTKLKYYRI